MLVRCGKSTAWYSPRQSEHRLNPTTSGAISAKSPRRPESANAGVPKELRTSFVSMMSHQGVPVEEISRLAGHSSSRTTEVIYRKELRPVITTGAEVMDQLFR